MENKIIKWVKENLNHKKIPLGAGFDDAALVRIPDRKIFISSDMLVEGTHFLSTEKPDNIGRKAAAISLSDMAAMGSFPLYLILSLGIPKTYPFKFVQKLFKGAISVIEPFQVKIVGGDTVRSSQIVVDTVVVGVNRKGKILKRSGANPGDLIFTTGMFGDSFSTGWHYQFIPRIFEMEFLKKKINISSAIDASDGLHASLRILSLESHVSFHIDCSKIQFRKEKKFFLKSMESALFDGEDFELVFTGRCQKIEEVRKEFQRKFRIPLSVIGKVCPGRGLKFFDMHKVIKIENKEFKHFV